MSKKFVCFGSYPRFVPDVPFTMNNGKYLVETGTFIPFRTQLEEMKRAGVDLMAHRMAHSDYLAGQTIDLDAEYIDWRDLDEFDLDGKRAFFLRQEILANQALQEQELKDKEDLANFRKMSAGSPPETSEEK